MAAWRTLGSMIVLLAAVTPAWAQNYPLIETVKAGDCFRIHLDMTLSGEMRVQDNGKTVPLKLNATAKHEFPERILNVDAAGLAEKSARVYEKAEAAIAVGSDRSSRRLRKERQLLVAQRGRELPLLYHPTGNLTCQELELTSEHLDTLALSGLLPGKEVAVGATWEVPAVVAQILCHFEGLTEHKLTCKLNEVKDEVAYIHLEGWANGIELGAQVKLKIEATYRFDLKKRRLVWLEWKQSDDREQGPASPASTVQTTTTMTRTVIEEPECLSMVALVSVPDGVKAVPEQMTNLEYNDPQNRFDMLYDRKWQIVGQTADHLVLRLMDRGDFTAQATITPWKKAEKGKHMTAEEFRAAIATVPGWKMRQELQAGEIPAGDGRWIYRLSAEGEMDGLTVLQNFYLVAGPGGEQVVLAITLTPKKAEQLGSRDLTLVASIDFPSNRKEGDKAKKP